MIRRPPRSTLFPPRPSPDLIGCDPYDHLRFVHATTHVAIHEEADPAEHSLLSETLAPPEGGANPVGDRKSTRLNSSHSQISYAVFCLKKKERMTARRVRD